MSRRSGGCINAIDERSLFACPANYVIVPLERQETARGGLIPTFFFLFLSVFRGVPFDKSHLDDTVGRWSTLFISMLSI